MPDSSTPQISIVLPYYNEEAFLPATLKSLVAQQLRPFCLVLVDNGSTDGSPALAHAFAAPGIRVVHLRETTPGQVHALRTGIAAVNTPFVAICDADTLYPPHYLAHALCLLEKAPAAIVGYIAHNAPANPASRRARFKRVLYTHIIPRLLPLQAHGGGYAHVLRTAALRAAGSYDACLWPYVLKDHELAHRLMQLGRLAYDTSLWCQPSPRRGTRAGVRWTLFERLLYHATPPATKDWFWYVFLKGRFEKRQLRDTVLRRQPWNGTEGKS